MKAKPFARKHFKRSTENFSRRVGVKSDALSVTQMLDTQKTGPKPSGVAGVLEVARQLALWFDIANGTAKSSLRFPEGVFILSNLNEVCAPALSASYRWPNGLEPRTPVYLIGMHGQGCVMLLQSICLGMHRIVSSMVSWQFVLPTTF